MNLLVLVEIAEHSTEFEEQRKKKTEKPRNQKSFLEQCELVE